jgi:hypothetical protein
MDDHRLVSPILPDGGSYHFTRCDWAFDFINYKPEFVDCLIDHINTHKLPSERVPLASTKGAISCKVVTGGQKTVYLGSPQSDRMLRVYDKRMQYVNLQTNTYTKLNPFGDPDSWFRIEWQTRNMFANNLVHGVDEQGRPADFKSILKDIFTRYAFADGTIDNNHTTRPVVDFWNSLFNWQELESRIVLNQKYVQPTTAEDRIIQSFERTMIRTFLLYYSILGREEVEKRVNMYLRQLEHPDPVSQRRNLAFLSLLNQLSDSIQLPPDTKDHPGGLWNFFGRLNFKI